MPYAHHIEIRNKILSAFKSAKMTRKEMAEKFNVSLTTIYNYWREYDVNGDIPLTCCQQAQLEMVKRVKQLMKEHPDSTHSEMHQFYNKNRKTKVSHYAISCALSALDFSKKQRIKKKTSKRYNESLVKLEHLIKQNPDASAIATWKFHNKNRKTKINYHEVLRIRRNLGCPRKLKIKPKQEILTALQEKTIVHIDKQPTKMLVKIAKKITTDFNNNISNDLSFVFDQIMVKIKQRMSKDGFVKFRKSLKRP